MKDSLTPVKNKNPRRICVHCVRRDHLYSDDFVLYLVLIRKRLSGFFYREKVNLIDYIKNLTAAMMITPATTVMDRLFVTNAISRVGTKVKKTGQSSVTKLLLSVSNKFSITRALRIQTGIKLSHFSTTSGSVTLRTNINGITRGNHVTNAQPIISHTIEAVVVIYLSPPQSSPQSQLQVVLLNVKERDKISRT